jgi:chemotaxis protein histidine kinase CheA
MLEEQDNEFILGIFLMEAWETVAAVEEGVRRLAGGEAPSPELVTPLVVVSHRLKGAAGLHGYPAVSAVALVMEEVLEALPATTDGEHSRPIQALGDMVGVVKRMLDSIGADGRENTEIMAELHARHPELFTAPPTLPPAPGTARAGDGGTHQSVVDRMLSELDRFFAEHADSVPYFVPEAAEHLDAMTRSLLVLEQSPTAASGTK